MKKYSLILVTLLLVGMILPAIPITTSNYSSEGITEYGLIENTPLSANGDDTNSIIRVSDDASVFSDSPDTNADDFSLEVRNDTGDLSRSWLKFNLTYLPDNIHFTRATVNLRAWSGVGTTDFPIGVFFSENNTWTEEDITWNNQPEYNAVPIAVIDAPASPNMFVVGNWYEWEITDEVIQTIEQDGILSLLIRLADEDTPGNTVLAFADRETSIANGFHGIPFVSLEYEYPAASDLLVDGFSESPQIDYISSANPEFSWSTTDADPNDFQKN